MPSSAAGKSSERSNATPNVLPGRIPIEPRKLATRDALRSSSANVRRPPRGPKTAIADGRSCARRVNTASIVASRSYIRTLLEGLRERRKHAERAAPQCEIISVAWVATYPLKWPSWPLRTARALKTPTFRGSRRTVAPLRLTGHHRGISTMRSVLVPAQRPAFAANYNVSSFAFEHSLQGLDLF